MVGARQLADHERVKPIRLAARDAKPIARRRDLIGMQRQHPQPRVQQPLDQQPVRTLDRDQLDPQSHSGRHSDRTPFSSCANVAATSFLPAASATSTSCLSDAQSTPAYVAICTYLS